MSNELNFSDRETYLKWRTEWRSTYAELSTSIRELKLNLRAAHRAHDLEGGSINDIHSAIYNLARAQARAREMLTDRAASKEKSAAQREEAIQRRHLGISQEPALN